MSFLKVTNIGTAAVGLDVAGVQYTIKPTFSQTFNTVLENEVQDAIAPFGSDLELSYSDPADIATAIFVSDDLELGVDFASGVQMTIPHGLGLIPTDITLSIVEEGETPSGSIAVSLDSAATASLDAAPTVSLDSAATAVLDAAPTISVDAAATASLDAAPTVSLDSAATASLDAAPVFTGDAATITPTVTLSQSSQITATVATKRLYTGAIVGATPVVGATLLQAVTGATATVTVFGAIMLNINTIVGVFDATNVVTGTNPDTSTFTFTPTMTLVDVWTLTAPIGGAYYGTADGLTPLGQVGPAITLGATSFRLLDATTLETLSIGAFGNVEVGYISQPSVTGASYTPTGSNDAPTITVTDATYTSDQPTITVTDATYTSDQPTITVTDATYTSDQPTITVTDAVYTAAFTGTAESTSLVQSAPADATNIYVTATTDATTLKIKVLAL